MVSEFELIRWIKKKIPTSQQGSIGIGDDADLIKLSQKNILVTTDSICEDIDFIRNELNPECVGRKALAINLSDIAAMGGNPVAYTLTLGLPAELSVSWVKKFYAGFLKMAAQYSLKCAGGDISGADKFFASVTLLGYPGKRIIRRNGAKSGHLIGVTGSLGGSILKHHYLFSPRVHEGRWLADFGVSAMMDISDGLWQDLEHILKSSGVSAVIDLEKIPISSDAKKLSKGDVTRALKRAMTEGEDFELLFTAPASLIKKIEKIWAKKFPSIKLSWIGEIVSGKEASIHWTRNGLDAALPFHSKRKGYQHLNG